MKLIEDYPQQNRFYTGLYSTKAFDFIRRVVNEWYLSMYKVHVVRAPDKEVVIAAYGPVTVDDKYARQDPSPENLKRVLCTCLSREMTAVDVPEPRRKTARAVFKYVTRAEDVEEECAKLIARLKGKQADPASTEIANCIDQETKRIENEHDAFSGELCLRHGYYGVAAMFGNSGWRPSVRSPERDSAFEHIDQAELSELNRLGREMREANNAFCEAVQLYEQAHEAYRDKLRYIKTLNTKTRNDRIKALKAEFREAKRASTGRKA